METKKCKYCQTEIDKKAKICPNCKKRVGGMPGCLIAIIVVIVIFVIIAASGGSDDNSNTSDSTSGTTNTSEETTSEEKTEYNVGDTYTSKYIKITYLSLEDYTSDNQFLQPQDGYKYIQLEFEFENISSTDQGVYSTSFKCYADGYDMDQSYLGDNYLSSTTLSSGKKTKGYIYFEVPEDAEEITAEYEDNVWTSNKVVFVVK